MTPPVLFARSVPPLLLAVLCVTAPASAQSFKWWHNAEFQRELALSQEQSDRLEEIFQSAIPALRSQKQALDQAEESLEHLVETADESAVMQQVDTVEARRAELSKSRTKMLLRMRKVLTTDQRTKLTALHEARERTRQRPQGRGR